MIPSKAIQFNSEHLATTPISCKPKDNSKDFDHNFDHTYLLPRMGLSCMLQGIGQMFTADDAQH